MAYAVTDRVVDLYVEVADQVEADLDIIEEGVFSRDSGQPGAADLPDEAGAGGVPPGRGAAAAAAGHHHRSQSRLVPKEIRRYFRDVQDHLTRTVEQVSSYDDLLNSILQARLAQVTVDQNNDMRKIAAWAGIAAVWTAFAGIYGMNFEYMPELNWQYGYPALVDRAAGRSRCCCTARSAATAGSERRPPAPTHRPRPLRVDGVPSRQDQLHSYQYSLQRVVAALVTHDPDPHRSPLRRAGTTALVSLVIAALAVGGAAVYGLLTGHSNVEPERRVAWSSWRRAPAPGMST